MIASVHKKMCGQAATCWLIGLLSLLAFSPSVGHATPLVTIDSWLLRATASDEIDGPGMQDIQWTDVQWPFHATQEAVAGNSSARVVYSFDAAGGAESFDFDVLLHRDGGPRPVGAQQGGDYARVYSEIVFTPASSIPYEINGDASLLGEQRIGFGVDLWNVSTNQPLFWNSQTSESTVNQQFHITGSDGDVNNRLEGMPTGTLAEGSQYRFRMSLDIRPLVLDQGAGAAGGFRLTLLPEPASLIAWSLAFLMLMRRKR